MLVNFETLEQIRHPSPQHPQEQSPFFQRLIPDVRRLIYLELFGSRPVHIDVARSFMRKPHFGFFTCRLRADMSPHFECRIIQSEQCRLSTSLLYTCQLAYKEGAELLFSSNQLQFYDQADFVLFCSVIPESFQNLVRSLDIYVQAQSIDYPDLFKACKLLSSWTSDVKLRMRWDRLLLSLPDEDEDKIMFDMAAEALGKMMENPKIQAMLWVPKQLQEALTPVLTQEAQGRLMLIEQPMDADGDDDGWMTDMMEDEIEDELAFELGYGSDILSEYYGEYGNEDDSEDDD
ncbi:hypothetical protein ACHAPT_012077 [Fusarium lateritium]